MLMHCLCTMFVRRLNFSLRPQAAYAEISERDGQTTGVKNKDRGRQRQRKRGREREAEKERQRNRVAHRALCKPLMRISLSQNLSCCLCAAWFLLSGAVLWLMRAYASPTWFEESPYAGLCGFFLDSFFLI